MQSALSVFYRQLTRVKCAGHIKDCFKRLSFFAFVSTLHKLYQNSLFLFARFTIALTLSGELTSKP